MPDSPDRLAAPSGIDRYLRDRVLVVLCAILVLSYVVGEVDFDKWVDGYPHWPIDLQLSMLPVHYWALAAILWRLGLRIWWIVPLVMAAVAIEAYFLLWSALLAAWFFFTQALP